MLARRGQIFRTRLAVLLENVLHFFVNKATVGTDNGMGQVPIQHFACIVHLEDDGISQLIFVLPQRAELIRQALGQHRDRAIHEVDARGALQGFAIDDVALVNVSRNVGDVDADFPSAICKRADGECVVKIFSIARVDRKGEHVAHIFALRDLFRRHAVRNLIRRFLYPLGVSIRQIKLGQNGVHFGVVLPFLTQNIHHFADRTLSLHRPLHDFYDDLVARLAAFQVLGRNEYIVGQHAAGRDEEGIIFLHFQSAYERII